LPTCQMTTEGGSDPEILTAHTHIYDRFHSGLTTEYDIVNITQ